MRRRLKIERVDFCANKRQSPLAWCASRLLEIPSHDIVQFIAEVLHRKIE